MKITAKTAIKKIEAGSAWVEGTTTTPEGEYWIVTTNGNRTHHVLCSDAPDLDKA